MTSTPARTTAAPDVPSQAVTPAVTPGGVEPVPPASGGVVTGAMTGATDARAQGEGVSGPVSRAPVLSLKEAAAACGVSVSTMRRRRSDLLRHGATTNEDGWSIPVPALVALGLMDRVTPATTAGAMTGSTAGSRQPARRTEQTGGQGADVHPPAVLTPTTTPPAVSAVTPSIEAMSAELAHLRERLHAEQVRAAVAEAVAAERERIISAQAAHLRMVEAAPAPAHESGVDLREVQAHDPPGAAVIEDVAPVQPPRPERERQPWWRLW